MVQVAQNGFSGQFEAIEKWHALNISIFTTQFLMELLEAGMHDYYFWLIRYLVLLLE